MFENVATLQQLFEQFDASRLQWQKRYKRNSDKAAARKRATATFDSALDDALGHPIPKLSMALSPTERALKAATTKDEALKVYDAAVAAAAAKYKGTTGRKYKKSVTNYKKSFDKRVSEIDKAYASASTPANGNSVTGSPAGSTNSGSAPPPTRTSLVMSTQPESDGPNLFLWAGVGALIWYFLKK